MKDLRYTNSFPKKAGERILVETERAIQLYMCKKYSEHEVWIRELCIEDSESLCTLDSS